MPVFFHNEHLRFQLKNKTTIKRWVNDVILQHHQLTGTLNFIFTTDEYLLEINRQYLNHDTYTDIITFDNSDDDKKIEGDIYISIERVKDNAEKLKVDFENELHRVMIHGVLHLLGYEDKSPAKKKKMREEENRALKLLTNITN